MWTRKDSLCCRTRAAPSKTRWQRKGGTTPRGMKPTSAKRTPRCGRSLRGTITVPAASGRGPRINRRRHRKPRVRVLPQSRLRAVSPRIPRDLQRNLVALPSHLRSILNSSLNKPTSSNSLRSLPEVDRGQIPNQSKIGGRVSLRIQEASASIAVESRILPGRCLKIRTSRIATAYPHLMAA